MTRTSMVLALLLLAGPRLLTAQRAVEAARNTPASGFDSFIMLVPPRDIATIKKNLRAATEAEALAETRRQQAETMRLGARSTIESRKVQIGRLKERIAVARKEDREADRLGMEAERKAAEREIDLLRRREELRQAEIDLEATRADQANLTAKALQLELQLATRRAGRGRAPAGSAGAASLDRVIGELEKQTLEAQRLQASSNGQVADREIYVIDRQLWLLDAQQRVLGGK